MTSRCPVRRRGSERGGKSSVLCGLRLPTGAAGPRPVAVTLADGPCPSWDYTGTGWISYLGNTDPIPDERAQYEAVRNADLARNDLAVDVDQVRPLLPGSATCAVVVTSRRHLSGLVADAGARRITLDVLSPVEAVALLGAAVGADRLDAEPEAADELARLCGHLPLALRIAGERVARSPHWTVSDLVDEFTAEYRRLDVLAVGDDGVGSVRAAFSWSYRELPAVAAGMFRGLGRHPGPEFGVPAAAALADLPQPEARRTLEVLVDAHRLQGRPDEALVHLREALTLWRQTDDRWGQAWTLHSIGETYLDLRRWDVAAQALREALGLFADIGHTQAEGFALTNLGRVHLGTKQFTSAIDEFQHAVTVHDEVGDRWSAAHTLIDLGTALHATGATAAATDHWRTALAICEDLNDLPAAEGVRALLEL